jgi:hypothetical protein
MQAKDSISLMLCPSINSNLGFTYSFMKPLKSESNPIQDYIAQPYCCRRLHLCNAEKQADPRLELRSPKLPRLERHCHEKIKSLPYPSSPAGQVVRHSRPVAVRLANPRHDKMLLHAANRVSLSAVVNLQDGSSCWFATVALPCSSSSRDQPQPNKSSCSSPNAMRLSDRGPYRLQHVHALQRSVGRRSRSCASAASCLSPVRFAVLSCQYGSGHEV